MDYWEENLYNDILTKALTGDPVANAKLIGYMVGTYHDALIQSGVNPMLLEDLIMDYQWQIMREVEDE